MSDLIGFLGYLIPSGSLVLVWQYLRRHRAAGIERRILDVLETHLGQALSVEFIHHESIALVLRDVKFSDVVPSLRPGGDPENENDLIPPKIPWRVRMRHYWPVRIIGEFPSKVDVRETLRKLQEKRLVRLVGEDRWERSS